jgi:hypothetical protein
VTTIQQINERDETDNEKAVLIRTYDIRVRIENALNKLLAPEENHGGQEKVAWQIYKRKSKKSSLKLSLHFIGKPRYKCINRIYQFV